MTVSLVKDLAANLVDANAQAIPVSFEEGRVRVTSNLPCTGGSDCPGRCFSDMPAKGHWAHDAINWALTLHVTAGTSPTTFSPNAKCTRAQVVTFLWRAAGSPVVEGVDNPFEDVRETDYYYRAVLWAWDSGITAGTSSGIFSPNAVCTRAQVVTFLWKAAGGEIVEGVDNPFTDVRATDYYYQAVLWASANNVTSGTSDTSFSPNAKCTRAQTVTFLWRAFSND